MRYTLGTAAKATGKSKPTIQRAIQSGKISANRKEDGSYEIDPAELHRVYDPVTSYGIDKGNLKQHETPNSDGVLQGQFEILRELVKELQGERDDLRRRLDEENQERRKSADEIRRLTLMIAHHPEPKAEEPDPRPPQAIVIPPVQPTTPEIQPEPAAAKEEPKKVEPEIKAELEPAATEEPKKGFFKRLFSG
jgi:hypothetical protein